MNKYIAPILAATICVGLIGVSQFGVGHGGVTQMNSMIAFAASAGPPPIPPVNRGGFNSFTPPQTETPPPPPPPFNIPTETVPITPLQPIDTTHTTDQMNNTGPQPTVFDALIGITESKGFPVPLRLKGPTDFILTIPETDKEAFERKTPYLVDLNNGTFLASVRRPSQTGYLHTTVADIAFSANSDAFVSTNEHGTRVRNVDGMGQALKVKINSGPGTGVSISVSPGYEIVIADHKLGKEDLRPQDGIARRGTHVLDGGQAAVSEYNVEGALQSSALVNNLTQKQSSDDKARRIVQDMSRMAAVLNSMNGTQGFNKQ